MTDALVVFNAGSSSLKFSIFACDGAAPRPVLAGRYLGLNTGATFDARDAGGALVAQQSWPAAAPLGHLGALAHLQTFIASAGRGYRLRGAGHRIVHGGVEFTTPVRIDADVLRRLEALTPLAPLHQPHNLEPIRVLREKRPDLPQVACFDTAFHRTQPAVAQSFALPAEITARGVRRYGFHGLSYEHLASVLPQYDPARAAGRVILLHLGHGSSLCAVRGGQSVATTMGFTALDGLPMGTRCGALDPGVVLFLLNELKMDAAAVGRLLYEQSGLLGVSGLSADMRTLLAADEPRARFAVDLYVYRIGRELGSLAAALGGLDAIVFAGGIGEGAAGVRARVCAAASWLGIEFDAEANAGGGPRISRPDSRVSAWVIPADEERTIARHTYNLLCASQAGVKADEPQAHLD